jgi:hypothetical protein
LEPEAVAFTEGEASLEAEVVASSVEEALDCAGAVGDESSVVAAVVVLEAAALEDSVAASATSGVVVVVMGVVVDVEEEESACGVTVVESVSSVVLAVS